MGYNLILKNYKWLLDSAFLTLLTILLVDLALLLNGLQLLLMVSTCAMLLVKLLLSNILLALQPRSLKRHTLISPVELVLLLLSAQPKEPALLPLLPPPLLP